LMKGFLTSIFLENFGNKYGIKSATPSNIFKF